MGSSNDKSFRARPGPESHAPRILVIRAGAIGDTLMTTPLVRALRCTFPGAWLVFICSGTAQDVLRHNPHLDEVIPLAYRHLPSWLSLEKSRLGRRLRELDLDWALTLESHPTFLDLARRSGARRVIAYGATETSGIERADLNPEKHCIENYLRAAAPLGVRPDGLETELYYPPEFDNVVRQRLASEGVSEQDVLVGIHAGWGSREHSLQATRLRSWSPQRFAETARWLAEAVGARVVLTGSLADQPLTRFIGQEAGVRCIDLAGKVSLLELAALIRSLDLYLTVDSGPAHMAAALGTPLVTLWGPGIFEQTRPLAGQGPLHILRHPVPCAPCYGTPLMKSCRDNICMKQIEVAEVQETIKHLLADQEPRKEEAIRARSQPRR